MARFRYTGTAADGKEIVGELTATSEADLAVKLLSQDISLRQTFPALSLPQKLSVKLLKSGEITRITRQIALLLENRISVLECLDLTREGTTDRFLSQILASLSEMIRQGQSVADAFGHFPDLFDSLYVNMLAAGELSGTLEQSFTRIAEYREQQEAAYRKLRGALAYPLLVTLVAVAVVVILVTYIVPVFASMYANFGAQLPTLTANVVNASQMARDLAPLWLALATVLIALLPFVVLSNRIRFVWHQFLLRIPIVRGLVIKLVTMRYCRTLGSLLTSGVDILLAADIAARASGNLTFQSALLQVPSALMKGQSLSESLGAVAAFPTSALRLVAAGEKTGQLGSSLVRAADYYEKETTAAIATLTGLIEPLVIIVLGVVVAFLLVALYLPLFDLVGSIN